MKHKPKVFRISSVPESLYELLEGQLKYLNKYYEVIGISSDGEFLNKTSNREKIETYTVPIRRRISPFFDIISITKMFIIMRQENPTIVHSITPKAGFISMVASFLARVPIRIHTFTGLIFPTENGLKKYLLIFVDKIICKLATNIIPEGKGVRNDLISHKITKKNIKVLHNGHVNGINIDRFKKSNQIVKQGELIKTNYGIASSEFIFCFVGRLVGDKGINELVQAFDKLLKNHKKIKLLLIGIYEPDLDPLRDDTMELIRETPSIIEVGYQDDVRPFLSISNIFVLPSFREGFPGAVMQAGAMGLPSIVTNINGCNEIIIDQINGLVIPPGNTKSLRNAMEYFITNPDKTAEYSNNARKLIVDRYDQKIIFRTVKKKYDLLLNEKGLI
mgnify:CR=1 FL=1